jgi:hypothetical protein
MQHRQGRRPTLSVRLASPIFAPILFDAAVAGSVSREVISVGLQRDEGEKRRQGRMAVKPVDLKLILTLLVD